MSKKIKYAVFLIIIILIMTAIFAYNYVFNFCEENHLATFYDISKSYSYNIRVIDCGAISPTHFQIKVSSINSNVEKYYNYYSFWDTEKPNMIKSIYIGKSDTIRIRFLKHNGDTTVIFVKGQTY